MRFGGGFKLMGTIVCLPAARCAAHLRLFFSKNAFNCSCEGPLAGSFDKLSRARPAPVLGVQASHFASEHVFDGRIMCAVSLSLSQPTWPKSTARDAHLKVPGGHLLDRPPAAPFVISASRSDADRKRP